MKINITQSNDKMTASLDRIADELDKKLAATAYQYWKKITPIDKGNARRSTRLAGNSIIADYPYARRLDEGWSRQAPRGMSEPTRQHIIQYLRRQVKK